jgi:hypothetical protein
MRYMTFTGVLASAIVAALLGAGAQAQQPPAGQAVADLSGVWNRLDSGGGGSYAGITAQFPAAKLLPAAAAKVPPVEDQGFGPQAGSTPLVRLPNGAYLTPAVAAAGGPGPTAGRCNIGGGGGGIDINSSGMTLMQSADEFIIARDGQAGGRRIYMNRPMPQLARISASNVGYSVGRWENGALVVTTTGLPPGVVAFGRGWRERDTVLTETFKQSPDGNRLTITYTWTDPNIYSAPHSYDINFERVKDGYVFETWCDASIDHPENYTSIAPPR